ncbi:MAG: hydrogenase maturation nickel metallochaperone HypA [Candidatus Heimdallarchaeota archaeon]|nr:hydrogenase maturation nickel metallochaperone HypA [Candidatus Heimdallarchaeota archaeon]
MHEYTITTQIVDTVIQSIAPYNVISVKEIELEVGEFSFIIPEQVESCFEIIIADKSIFKNTKLVFSKKPGEVKCDKCGYRGPIANITDEETLIPSFSCPECSFYVSIVTGNGCEIKNIKINEK